MGGATSFFQSLSDARVAVPGAFVLVVVLGIAWYYLASPLVGTVSATQVLESGAARAVRISLDDLVLSGYGYASNQNATALLAVPSPALDRAVFVTRARGEARSLSIAAPDGSGAVVVIEGEVATPSWSPDGGSIAFSRFDGDTEGATGSPEEWTVFRAVRSGDVLSVGKGFRPFPSRHQRTFALTNNGVALLSYNDAEPTLVIASPVPVPASTPFAVSQDGTRVAWVAPADHSLQVFEDVNGYFIPIIVTKDIVPQSLVFSPNNRYLIGTTNTGATTTLNLITVSSGRIRAVHEFPGFLELHAWRYEK